MIACLKSYNKPVAIGLVLLLLGNRVKAFDETESRRYSVDAQLYSFIPELGIDSYFEHGKGGGPGHQIVNFSVSAERQFSIDIESQIRSGKFTANVKVKPRKSDILTSAIEQECDLSTLEPQLLDISRGEDGRVYRLLLMPKIIEHNRPPRLQSKKLDLKDWYFPNSPVLLNGFDFVGRVDGNGRFVSIDIVGTVKVDISLLPFKGATPNGTLQDGVVYLRRGDKNVFRDDDTMIWIEKVCVGIEDDRLAEGPYQVYVRWSEPSMSLAQYQKLLKDDIENLKKDVDNDLSEQRKIDRLIEKIERQLNSGHVLMTKSYTGPIPKEDRITNAVP